MKQEKQHDAVANNTPQAQLNWVEHIIDELSGGKTPLPIKNGLSLIRTELERAQRMQEAYKNMPKLCAYHDEYGDNFDFEKYQKDMAQWSITAKQALSDAPKEGE